MGRLMGVRDRFALWGGGVCVMEWAAEFRKWGKCGRKG
jgi:hypothetical protein